MRKIAQLIIALSSMVIAALLIAIFSLIKLSYIGAAVLLAAYALIDKTPPQLLHIANCLGALFLAIDAIAYHAWAFVVLNVFWMIIGLKNILTTNNERK